MTRAGNPSSVPKPQSSARATKMYDIARHGARRQAESATAARKSDRRSATGSDQGRARARLRRSSGARQSDRATASRSARKGDRFRALEGPHHPARRAGEGDRDAGIPARRRARVLRSARAARQGLETFYAVSPIPDDWTSAGQFVPARIQHARDRRADVHEAMPGHYVQLWHSNQYPSVLRACWLRARSSKAGPSTPNA